MTEIAHHLYVISDLHLGGEVSRENGDVRGFRICTNGHRLTQFVSTLAESPVKIELVINGDVVDFLAERDDDGRWSAFTADQDAAIRKLDRIIDREQPFFSALATLLERKHRLTVLPGNHDIELTLPAVRQRFAERLKIAGHHDFHFLYDGEAYCVGRVLIEHGNRYDPFNIVDYDALRRLRSFLSRHLPVPYEANFEAPAGSHMVSDVINEIKSDYGVIDLLKPEIGAAIPLLLALEPGYRRFLRRVAELALRARGHRLTAPTTPTYAGEMSVDFLDPNVSEGKIDPLTTVVRGSLGDDAGLVLDLAVADESFARDISTSDTVDRTLGLARLLVTRQRGALDSRLPALLAAVRALQNDKSFERNVECFPEYFDAASELASDQFDAVVFGHTHLAREIALPAGGKYLNAGTWADFIRFPADILAGPTARALEGLRAFTEDMRDGLFERWVSFVPTYVKVALDSGGTVRDAAVHNFLDDGVV